MDYHIAGMVHVSGGANGGFQLVQRKLVGDDGFQIPAATGHDNMTECVGVGPEPEPVEEPEPTPEPEPKQAGGNTGTILLILAVALVGGGAGWYFKIYRPKQQRAAETEEDYGDELETYDDTPPWDEEDEDETEGDK